MSETRRYQPTKVVSVTRVASNTASVSSASDYLAGFLLDASGSTAATVPNSGGRSILQCAKDALIDAIKSMRGSNNISRRLRITVRVFSGDRVDTILPLTLIDEIDMDELIRKLDTITPFGMTPMGKAIVDLLNNFRNTRGQIIRNGGRCAHPMMCVITDGLATDNENMEQAYRMVDALLRREGQPHLSIIPIGFSQNAADTFPQLQRLILHDAANERGIIRTGKDFSKLVRLIEQTQVAVERGIRRPTLNDIIASDTPSFSGIRVTPQSSFGRK